MNNLTLTGRLVRDPESRTMHNGKTVTEFTIAVRKRIKPKEGEKDSDFFRVKAFGQAGDFAANYFTKGLNVGVSGRIESRRYDKDGVEKEVWEVMADQVETLERPRDDANTGSNQSQNRRRTKPAAPDPGEDYDPFADE